MINRIFRSIHSIKGNAGFLGFANIQKLAHAMENFFGAIRSEKLRLIPEFMDPIFKGLDCLKNLIGDLQNSHLKEISEFVSAINGLTDDGKISEEIDSGSTSGKKSKISSSSGTLNRVSDHLPRSENHRLNKPLEKPASTRNQPRSKETVAQRSISTGSNAIKSIPELVVDTKSSNGDTRFQAFGVLSQFAQAEVTTILLPGLFDPDERVQMKVLATLEGNACPLVIGTIRRALNTSSKRDGILKLLAKVCIPNILSGFKRNS